MDNKKEGLPESSPSLVGTNFTQNDLVSLVLRHVRVDLSLRLGNWHKQVLGDADVEGRPVRAEVKVVQVDLPGPVPPPEVEPSMSILTRKLKELNMAQE